MDDLALFREYEPHECAPDGYPFVWRELSGDALERALDDYPWLRGLRRVGVKDLVRGEAHDRCVRCGHPYVKGRSGLIDPDEHEEELAVAQLLLKGGERVLPAKLRPIQWSPCDESCTHDVRACRWRNRVGEWTTLPMNIDEDAEQQAAWRILTVHHLNERKHDLRWWNLAALCQRCHLHIQKKVLMERVYPFEHTDWFKPHAAGWYAYVYEGKNLTRSEAEEDAERLLALERLA